MDGKVAYGPVSFESVPRQFKLDSETSYCWLLWQSYLTELGTALFFYYGIFHRLCNRYQHY